jgi:hypothetical protein
MPTYQSAIEFGIAIIFPMVIYFGVRTFHPPPKLNALRIHAPQTTPEETQKAAGEFGGIFSLVNGYFQYWRYLENWIRFASLLAAFAVLVFVGYAKFAP